MQQVVAESSLILFVCEFQPKNFFVEKRYLRKKWRFICVTFTRLGKLRSSQ